MELVVLLVRETREGHVEVRDDELAAAMSHIGVSKITIDGDAVVKTDPCARVDVGGAAKGYVADRIAAVLRDAGVESADIDLGGNLFLMGNHPEGRPWRMAVRIPAICAGVFPAP